MPSVVQTSTRLESIRSAAMTLLTVGASASITIANRAMKDVRRSCARSNMVGGFYCTLRYPEISSYLHRSKPAYNRGLGQTCWLEQGQVRLGEGMVAAQQGSLR